VTWPEFLMLKSGNVNLPEVMVENDLRIRRFMPPAEKLLNLLRGDVCRRLGEIRSNIEPDDLEQVARNTIENAVFQEREVRLKDGPWYLLRVRPYKTWEDKIEGAVLSFQDIDSLKRTLDQTCPFAEALIENARESILVLDEGLRVTLANPVFYRNFQVSPRRQRDAPSTNSGTGNGIFRSCANCFTRSRRTTRASTVLKCGTNSSISDFGT
jgi:two-component system CheB/CheR fusion protein